MRTMLPQLGKSFLTALCAPIPLLDGHVQGKGRGGPTTTRTAATAAACHDDDDHYPGTYFLTAFFGPVALNAMTSISRPSHGQRQLEVVDLLHNKKLASSLNFDFGPLNP